MKNRGALASLIFLCLIVLLGLGLRLYGLDAQSLWYDEGFSIYLARMDPGEITARTAADIQPPLYYYLLHGWIQLFGDGEWAVRSLALLFGVLTIPLMYGVARQLFGQSPADAHRGRLTGLLAALILAVSPLHLWYSQETRMYTLLTLLCLLSSFLLLLLMQAGKKWQVIALWLGFTLTSIAAVYTHYFAFFVLAFQALYLLFVWWRRGFRPQQLILGGLASGALIILAYLPWLPHLVTRFGEDVSYWPGQLKLHEVLIDIALSFVGGESVAEVTGIVLTIGYGLVFLLCLVALAHQGWRNPPDRAGDARYPLVFLLFYLLLPPALILLLSYSSPKFNARYAMVSYPALVLLMAGGLATLWQRGSSRASNLVRWSVAGVALAFVLGVSAYADYNTFTNPAFSRADFRGAARYVGKHMSPHETIILSSGHMFPVFDYYAPGMERLLLPDSPTLDTTRTLDYSIAADLNDWLRGRDGVWLVLWQDEVVDPAGYLSTMLAEIAEEQAIDRSFAEIELRHYRLPADSVFSDQPAIDHPADLNFGNRLRLLGYSQTGDHQVTLFWQALQPMEQDYRVSLVLRDPEGQDWGQWDGRPSAYFYPTDRWQVGQIVFGRYNLTPIPGTPPGDYGLDIGVYTEAEPVGLDLLDATGAPQGKRAMLGAVRLSVPATTAEQVEAPHPDQIDMGGGLLLVGWGIDRDESQPGDRLRLTLFWSVASQPMDDYRIRLLVTDAGGRPLDAGTFPPTNIWHPTSTWQEGQVWRGQATFHLPFQAQPGEAQLSVQLEDSNSQSLGSAVDLAKIQVTATDRVFVPPEPQIAHPADFEDRVALLGADLHPDPVSAGAKLQVTLYWQALAGMGVPYTAFVHLLGPEGQVIAGHDSEPAGGERPTTGWVAGEYVADLHELSIPDGLAPGEYRIEVGLYDAGAPNLPRLSVLGEGGQVEADRVILGSVQVR